MHIVGTKNQSGYDPYYDASGTITTGGTAQLVRARVPSCSHFFIQNNSAANAMFVEFGAARATCTISSGAVSTFSITNAGFNYTNPPLVGFSGGGNAGNSTYLGLNQPGGTSPNTTLSQGRPARAEAVLTAGAVSSIVLLDGGSGYVIAPYVFIYNSDLDPYGAALPASGVGIQLGAGGGAYYVNGTSCPTDQISIWCSASAQHFTCKWMT